MVKKIILANPRGFCAGVTRAIQIVEKALEKYNKQVYMYHQIVHNETVVKNLEKKGVIFLESIKKIPKNSVVIFSAHGTKPQIKKLAEEKELIVIDAVCPLVVKVHEEAKKYHKKGFDIILIGHEGHQEVIGTMSQAPMTLVRNEDDVNYLKINNDKIIYLMQTTLSIDESKSIVSALKKRYPKIHGPGKDDICYATTNRQKAVKKLAEKADLILVVGSMQSSNSKRLVETAKFSNVKAYLIENIKSIDKDWLKDVETVGITSGASAPESVVQEVVQYIQKLYKEVNKEDLIFMKENVNFILPKIK